MGFLYSLIRIEHLARTIHENIHEPILIRIVPKWYTWSVLLGIYTFNGEGVQKVGHCLGARAKAGGW